MRVRFTATISNASDGSGIPEVFEVYSSIPNIAMNVYVVLLIQILLASGTHIVAKSVVRDVDTLTLMLLRGVISSVGLALFFLSIRRTKRIERGDWWELATLGFFATLNQLLYLYGIRFTTAANAALLYATTPVFVLLFASFTLKEKITPKKTAGILLAFIGVSVVIFERGISLSTEYACGDLIILAAVLCWTVFTIRGKPMVLKYGATKATTAATILGSLMFLPFGIIPAVRFQYSSLSSLDWAGVFYLGIGMSVVGYFLWYYALKHIDASKLAVFSNGQPVGATILSMIFLNYVITPNFVVGGLVTIAGVILTQLG